MKTINSSAKPFVFELSFDNPHAEQGKPKKIVYEKEAYDKACKINYEKGYAEGKSDAEKENAAILLDICQQINQKLESLEHNQEQYQELLLAMVRGFARLALNEYTNLLDLESFENLALKITQEIYHRVDNSLRFSVHVNPEILPKLRQAFSNEERILFVADETLCSGMLEFTWDGGGAIHSFAQILKEIDQKIQNTSLRSVP